MSFAEMYRGKTAEELFYIMVSKDKDNKMPTHKWEEADDLVKHYLSVAVGYYAFLNSFPRR